MGPDETDHIWKTIRSSQWAKKHDGTWIEQRSYRRVKVPNDRSRARDHTKVPSKIIRSVYKKRMWRYWDTLDPKILERAQANSKYVNCPDPDKGASR
jgi:hypothetical protein